MDSDSGELQDLRARIVKLEKRGSKWRVGIFIVLLVYLAANFVYVFRSLGHGVSSLSARNLVIKDERGHDRIIMNCTDHGPGILLLGNDHVARASLVGHDDGSASLWLGNPNGRSLVVLGTDVDTSAFLSLGTRTSSGRSLFGVRTGDSTRLDLRDANNKPLLHLP